MSRARWLLFGTLVALGVGLLLLYDALVVTEKERVEALADDVAGPVIEARIAEARRRWVDLERQPLEVSAFGRIELYRSEDEALLERRIRALAHTHGQGQLRVLVNAVEIDGRHARSTMRIHHEREGLRRLEWTLTKHGGDWLVSRLRVGR